MKNAPDRKAVESARNSANSTASSPCPDLKQAVEEIRVACATIARLAAHDASIKEVHK